MEDFLQRYLLQTEKSSKIQSEAKKVLPGGNTRHTYLFKPRPFYVKSASGCKIVDVDGNERYDFLNNMGVLILGNNHPRILEAVKRTIENGIGFAAPTELEVELAKMMCEAIPCADKVRFTASGTEATMTAVRAARAFTGKNLIAKFEGHYHGTHDYAQVSTKPALEKAGPPTSPTPLPDSKGVPREIVESMLILPWNDFPSCEVLIRKHKEKLAAVLLDPIANQSGVIPPKNDFLKALKECTEENDTLLCLDEVLTGFRLAYGGAQEYYGIKPDLATFGKIIGGGFPVGAIAGRDDIMDLFSSVDGSEPKIKHAGTFNAHPVTMAAGIATLKELKPELYQRINSNAKRIKTEIENVLTDMRITGFVSVAGSFMYLIHFGVEDITNLRDTTREDKELAWQFALGSICDGIYLMPTHSCNLSAAFTSEDITQCINIMTGVLKKMCTSTER